MEKIFITVAGEKALRERLKAIKEFDRPKNIRDIEEARAHGDLSENAEYHAAKERQGQLDAEMRMIEDKLGRAETIDPTKLSGNRVVFGATVTLYDLDNDERVVYQVVGADEADPLQGRISYVAPIGKALIGKRVGDAVEVKAPGGIREYQVEEIEFK